MKFKRTMAVLSGGLFLTGLAIFAGCETTQEDVTAARNEVREEQRETEEVRREANEEIREKQQELDKTRHEAMRPDYDNDRAGDREADQEEIREKQEELNEAKEDANERIAEEERETAEAKREAAEREAELTAKKERDAFLAPAREKLEAVDERINSLQEQADDAEGTRKQELDTDIEVLQVKRDNLSDAISAVEDAELTEWESEKALVEQALERLNDEEKENDKE